MTIVLGLDLLKCYGGEALQQVDLRQDNPSSRARNDGTDIDNLRPLQCAAAHVKLATVQANILFGRQASILEFVTILEAM